jgi:hypothetical protein
VGVVVAPDGDKQEVVGDGHPHQLSLSIL